MKDDGEDGGRLVLFAGEVTTADVLREARQADRMRRRIEGEHMKAHTENYRGWEVVATPHSATASRAGAAISAPNYAELLKVIDRWWTVEGERTGEQAPK